MSAGGLAYVSGGGGGNVSITGNTAGVPALVSTGTLYLAGGPNVTLSQNGNSISISAGTAAAANLSVSAGTTSGAFGGITFSNLNGASFGLNNGTITASVNSTSNAGLGTAVTGHISITMSSSGIAVNAGGLAGTTTAVSGNASLTLNSAGLQLNASNLAGTAFATTTVAGTAVAATLNTTGLTLAVPPYITTQTVQTQASGGIAGTGFTSTTTAGTAVVGTQNSNGLSLGVPLYLTAGTGAANLAISGNTSGVLSTISSGTAILAGGNNITLSQNGQSITISGANVGGAQTGISGVIVSNTTYTSGTISFVNSNGISFGSSGANGISASYSVPTVPPLSIGVSNIGNTSGNTGTYSGQAVLAGGNNITLSVGTAGGGAQTITINAPATSSLVGAGGVSVSTNGSTISVYPAAMTRLIWPWENLTAISVPTLGAASIQYVVVDWPVTATRIDALASWGAMGSSASAVTAAIAMSAYAAIFTRNVSTLSSLSSGSTQTTYSYRSNNAGNTELQAAAMRPISVPVNVYMTPGEYFVAFNLSTATSSVGAATTSFGLTLSMMGGNQVQTAANYAEIGAATATSTHLLGGMGVYTSATTGISASLALSNIAQTGTSLSQANIAIVFRNG